jgi:pantoate--beta-alanine ligase
MTKILPKVNTVSKIRHQVSTWRAQGHTIALVPTMGGLHEGHLSLVDLAHEHCDRVIVSIFVNPTQFSPKEDFATYPRNIKADTKMLQQRGTHLIYQPLGSEMYGENETTRVTAGKISQGLCGASRPHFFSGVATVVCKLLCQVTPDIAVFGEKDYQQLLVIRTMVRDLCIATEIIGGKLIREADGLAMSSRNVYLSPSERKKAPFLFKTLQQTAEIIKNGHSVVQSLKAAKAQLVNQDFEVDYLELRDTTTLAPVKNKARQGVDLRLFAAVFLGKTRLIDNMKVCRPKV